MEDLIARLYPHGEFRDGYATRTIGSSANSSRVIDLDLPELPGRDSRESTAPPDGGEEAQTNRVLSGKALQLTFTHGPKSGPGFLLGMDANSCDIVLPALKGISRRHCYLTFVARRLILRDCSTNGTTVTYDGKGGEKRRYFTWILGGHKDADDTESIIIQIHPALKFQVVVAKPSFPDLYEENVSEFLKETAVNATLPLGALGIQSVTSTVAPSGTQTPSHDPILLDQETLGSGSFAEVTRVWDVSTGLEYASKKFFKAQVSDWRREASIMRQSLHISDTFVGNGSLLLTIPSDAYCPLALRD